MKKGTYFILGAVVGAVACLLLAPQTGRRTRALIRDKTTKYLRDIAHFADRKSKHLANKARGYAHEVRDVLAGRIVKRETEAREEAAGS